MKTDNLYWVWLACRLGAANPDFQRLIVRYENPYEIYRADAADLLLTEGLGEKTAGELGDKSLAEASGIVSYCSRTGADIIPYTDERYPNRLRLLRDPPVLLYARGELPQMNSLVCVAVVGTRRMSAYGRECGFHTSWEPPEPWSSAEWRSASTAPPPAERFAGEGGRSRCSARE